MHIKIIVIYYFGGAEDGTLKTGWQTINKNKYYFKRDGNTGIRGKMLKGFNDIGINKYYFGISDGRMKTGWVEHNKRKYYMNSNGVMVTGWETIGNDKYYFKPTTTYGVLDGSLVVSNWTEKVLGATKTHYTNETGKLSHTTSVSDQYSANKSKYARWYAGTSKYADNARVGQKLWNEQKKDVFQEVTSTQTIDIKIVDYYVASPYQAIVNHKEREIACFPLLMDENTNAQNNFILTHEMGHVLGLGHNWPDDLMRDGGERNSIIFTKNDKESLKKSLERMR